MYIKIIQGVPFKTDSLIILAFIKKGQKSKNRCFWHRILFQTGSIISANRNLIRLLKDEPLDGVIYKLLGIITVLMKAI